MKFADANFGRAQPMHMTRLRLLGFKSFVDPTDLLIEPGLTGVVGPNGCGKSNLLEALRWAMGETSYKSMRGSAMDDVIFSGSQNRPARNTAEVTLFLDNSDRKAPPEFNGTDTLEVTRRIEREAGSAYRINGQDARARDVKVLFEDAASGARSPALVRQGQISEIVNAKPSDRRRILEDAAGIAGLHTRRHEADLRLKGAEGNLVRVRDVLGQLTSQLESLKRQARAARRYKDLSAEIRSAEAVQLHLGWSEAQRQVVAEESQLSTTMAAVGLATQSESEALRQEAGLAETIQPLREEEAVRGAVLQRLKIEDERLKGEEERATARTAEIEARISQMSQDLDREQHMITEALEQIAQMDEQASSIETTASSHATLESEARTHQVEAHQMLLATEEALTEVQGALAEERASIRQLEQAYAEHHKATIRLEEELNKVTAESETLAQKSKGLAIVVALSGLVQETSEKLEAVEEQALDAEQVTANTQDIVRAKRDSAMKLAMRAGQLSTEVATLKKLLTPAGSDASSPIVDQLTVEPGFEIALGAAMGDDLAAPADEASPIHWRSLDGDLPADSHGDPALPKDATPLLDHVQGAPELHRRLAQIGIVERTQGPLLQPHLKPGQRLVTLAGDLWRWDGYVAAADAPSAAAQRLSERNRLAALEIEEEDAAAKATTSQTEERAATEVYRKADAREKELRASWRETQGALDKARSELAVAERAARDTHERLAVLAEAKTRTALNLEDTRTRAAQAKVVLDEQPPIKRLEERLASVQDALIGARENYSDAAASVTSLDRERQSREMQRSNAIRDRERWLTRQNSASTQIKAIESRLHEAQAELDQLGDLPEQIEAQRLRILTEVSQAEQQRKAAADRLAESEMAMRSAQSTMAAAREAVSAAREARARIEARLESARTQRTTAANVIREAFNCAPQECLTVAGIALDTAMPALADVERQLQRLRADRGKIDEQFQSLDKERADLEEAIAKLRGGISQLNKEGRKRLMEAFETVNGHFQRLFGQLFNGGEARLEMIESEDPLEGGLEIVAKPPGKKPNVMSLLSGGEQTLTALSLIFAVFLTNPSPICVLDEVDAPLDDSNVDRFCGLMEHMARDTDTRFLVITHHPVTMARMNRLFGVTMGERGVSQLVSVDLATAERFREAS
jgi:chromosome segregation protein